MAINQGDIIARIGSVRLLPVVVLDDADHAGPLAEALIAGGLPVAEVTFRTAAAAASIRRMIAEHPGMLVGAGTVLTETQVREAADAGAAFILTPGFNPTIVEAALRAGIPIIPGINNPSGVEQAMSFGLSATKFFPAEASGGVPFIKALGGPYGEMRFVPTGGVGLGNLAAYLALKNVLACGGSWMVEPALIRAGRFADIAKLTADAVALAQSVPIK